MAVLLYAKNVHVAFGTRTILDIEEIAIRDGARIGLIGRTERPVGKRRNNFRKIRMKRAERLFQQSAALRRKRQHYLTLSA